MPALRPLHRPILRWICGLRRDRHRIDAVRNTQFGVGHAKRNRRPRVYRRTAEITIDPVVESHGRSTVRVANLYARVNRNAHGTAPRVSDWDGSDGRRLAS